MTRDFERQFPLPWTVRHNEYGTWVAPCAYKMETEAARRSVENGTYPIWSSNGYPARYEAIRYAVACANLMPEAEDLIKSFVVLCKDYKLTASIKCNGEEVDAPLIDIFQRGCEAFLSKLGDVAK